MCVIVALAPFTCSFSLCTLHVAEHATLSHTLHQIASLRTCDSSSSAVTSCIHAYIVTDSLHYYTHRTTWSTSLPPSLTQSLTPSLPPSHTQSLTHSHTHSVTHSLTHTLSHSVTHSLTHTLSHSPTHPPTHSPTHPPTHSLTHPPTHSLTLNALKGWQDGLELFPHVDLGLQIGFLRGL